jgi:electron transport complex protein RnfB
VAWIDEERCIGCARCLPACPVDAIVGAPRQMHTVIAAQCTGCELCLPPCPVDCIELRAALPVPLRYKQPRVA